MGQILYILLVGIVLVLMFTVLVAAHEYGHYLFARLFNMGVEEFAIGFGKLPKRGGMPQFWTWMTRRYRVPMLPGQVATIEHEDDGPKFDLEATGSRPIEDITEIDTPTGKLLEEVTRFTVRPWPLGGYVRIKGMVPEDDGSEIKIAGGFYSKPPWQRLIVLFAGPLFSVLAGIAILTPLKMYIGGDLVNKPVLATVVDGTAAAKAGLKNGDRILAINGRPVSSFFEVVQVVRNSNGTPVQLDIDRDGADLHISVKPELEKQESYVLKSDLTPSDESKKQYKLGAAPPRAKVGLGEALVEALDTPIIAVKGLLGSVRHPSTLKENVGGPIMITRFTYQTVRLGIPYVLELAALLSISVGVFNLLPCAPLDGGQMMMALWEMFRRGRRLSIRMQGFINGVGLMFMCLLILCVFVVDIGRLVGGDDPLKPPPKKTAPASR